MNKKTKTYRGFSMVEMMLLLIIVSLMLASGVTVISKKHVKVPRLSSHGAYICYEKNGVLHQEKYLGIGLDNKIMDEDTDQCVFEPPARASYLHIQATGGGGGGGASGYKGGTLFTYESKTEVISPFGWTQDRLDLKGMHIDELKKYGGNVWAYADGTGEFGDGGGGGDAYYIKQDCANGACIVWRSWEYTGTKERKCDCGEQVRKYSKVQKYKYEYYNSHSASWPNCEYYEDEENYYCNSYPHYETYYYNPGGSNVRCVHHETEREYDYGHSVEECAAFDYRSCYGYDEETGKCDYCWGYNEVEGDCDRWEKTYYECSSCSYDTRHTSYCTDEWDIPTSASCSETGLQNLTVDVTITEAKETERDSHYRLKTKDATLHDGDDVKERTMLRDTGEAKTVCNYGNSTIYPGTGIFGSFMEGEVSGVSCDTSSLAAAFGEQIYKIGEAQTSVHSTKTVKASEVYNETAGGTDEEFPMYMRTEDEGGLSVFGESCVNTYNGDCESNEFKAPSGGYKPPKGGNIVNKEPLYTACSYSPRYWNDDDSNMGCDRVYNAINNRFTKYGSQTSNTYWVYERCDCVQNNSSDPGECVYDYGDVDNASSTELGTKCSYIPDVVKGGAGGVGKFCALNDVPVTLGLNYKGESSIFAGIRGSDRLLTNADYKPLYTEKEWKNQEATASDKGVGGEHGTPSQGSASIRISGGEGGEYWCELHKDKVPGRGEGARRYGMDRTSAPVAGSSAPVTGAPSNEAAIGSIDGQGYTENKGRKCGGNHVGYCLRAKDQYENDRPVIENGKYTYSYTWNTNYLQYGEGGEAGEYRVKIIRAIKDKPIEITLGRGGAAGSDPSDTDERSVCDGGDGGDTIVGDILTAEGGKGGKGCIPTVTEQLPYWFEGGHFYAKQPGTPGKLASVTNYKTNIINLVLPIDNSVLGAWIEASGAGGNGGGSINNCWASEWQRWFNGAQLEQATGGKLDAAQLERDGCRNGTYWGTEPAQSGTAGAVLIKW